MSVRRLRYSSRVPRLRWGTDAPTGADEARARLVVAAATCVDRFGLGKTTVEDVATEAKVSRATIYRYFANRDELLLGVMLRELEQSPDDDFTAVIDAVSSVDELVEVVVVSSERLLERIRTNPKLRLWLTTEGPGVSATLAGASQALFAGYAEDVGPHLERLQTRGLLRDDRTATEISEWILRVILSLLTVDGPGPRNPDEERSMLRAFLAPALVPAAATVATPR